MQYTDNSQVQKVTLDVLESDIYRAAGNDLSLTLGRMLFLSLGPYKHMPQLRTISDKGLVVR